jgi:hypothetical protein
MFTPCRSAKPTTSDPPAAVRPLRADRDERHTQSRDGADPPQPKAALLPPASQTTVIERVADDVVRHGRHHRRWAARSTHHPTQLLRPPLSALHTSPRPLDPRVIEYLRGTTVSRQPSRGAPTDAAAPRHAAGRPSEQRHHGRVGFQSCCRAGDARPSCQKPRDGSNVGPPVRLDVGRRRPFRVVTGDARTDARAVPTVPLTPRNTHGTPGVGRADIGQPVSTMRKRGCAPLFVERLRALLRRRPIRGAMGGGAAHARAAGGAPSVAVRTARRARGRVFPRARRLDGG